jgi:hypothetical protein
LVDLAVWITDRPGKLATFGGIAINLGTPKSRCRASFSCRRSRTHARDLAVTILVGTPRCLASFFHLARELIRHLGRSLFAFRDGRQISAATSRLANAGRSQLLHGG